MVLEESTYGGFDHIISWIGNNAFKVHDPIQFEESIMQRFFNQTQYKSFQRQLNIYGFTRVKTAGKATGSYTHPLFIRGNPDACSFMIRVKVKKKGIRKNLNRSNSKESTTSSKGDSIMGKSFDALAQPIEATSSTLHRRFCVLENPSRNGAIEPTPIRSVSPTSSATNKNIITIEPTPIDALGCSNSSSTMGSPQPIISNINVIGCNNGCFIDRESINAGRHHGSIRPVTNFSSRTADSSNDRRGMIPLVQQPEQNYFSAPHCNNVDLDLDTIFDDDNNKYKLRETTHYYTDSSRPSNPFRMDSHIFEHNFQTVENSLSDLLTKRSIDIH